MTDSPRQAHPLTDAARATPGNAAPLRVGVMLDTTTITAWEAKVLRDIRMSDFASLELVVTNGSLSAPAGAAPLSRGQRLRLVWPTALFALYSKLDRKLGSRRVPLDAFEPTDAAPLLQDVPCITAHPIQKKFTDRFSADDIASIRDANLDVMIRFGFRIIRGEILDVARHGVWSMHHGDSDEYRGGPAHFWEIYEGNPLSGVVLQVLSDELDAGTVIYRSWGRTHPHSLFLNRNPIYWKSAEFYMRRLRQLHERGGEFLATLDDRPAPPPYTRGIYRNPTNIAMVRYLARIGWRWFTGWVQRKLKHEAWFVAWRRRDGEDIGIDRGELQFLKAPSDRYYADPFLLTHAGSDWLFFEDYPYATGKGLIACASLDETGQPGEVIRVLERPYHLSFPFLMHDPADNTRASSLPRLLMIPETRGNGCIEQFQCVDFPRQWEPAGPVMPGVSAADTVIFSHDGTWWLLTNIAVAGAAGDDELSLFFSKTAAGPWHPHPLNPIVSDVRHARMAGAVFPMNGSLVRPAQDGSRGYGSGVVFHRIDVLTRHDYRETIVSSITDVGIPGNIGTHTYNRNERYEVIDGRVLKWRWT